MSKDTLDDNDREVIRIVTDAIESCLHKLDDFISKKNISAGEMQAMLFNLGFPDVGDAWEDFCEEGEEVTVDGG